MRSLLLAFITLAVIGSCTLAIAATADVTAAPEPAASSLIDDAYQAVTSGHWRHVAALLLIGVVASVRKFQAHLPAIFRSDRGRVMLVFALAFAGAVGHTALAGASFTDWHLWKTAGLIAIEAMGTYIGAKKLLFSVADPDPDADPDADPPADLKPVPPAA